MLYPGSKLWYNISDFSESFPLHIVSAMPLFQHFLIALIPIAALLSGCDFEKSPEHLDTISVQFIENCDKIEGTLIKCHNSLMDGEISACITMWEDGKSSVHAAIDKNIDIAEEIGSATFVEISSHLKALTQQWENVYGHLISQKPHHSAISRQSLPPLSKKWLLEDFAAEIRQYHFYLDRVMSDYLNMMHSSRMPHSAPRS